MIRTHFAFRNIYKAGNLMVIFVFLACLTQCLIHRCVQYIFGKLTNGKKNRLGIWISSSIIDVYLTNCIKSVNFSGPTLVLLYHLE